MTTPTGVIKASDIRTEFGATSGDQNTGPVSLGAYRISQTVSGMSGLSLDNEYDSSGKIIKLIPQGTNAISFDNLRGRRLNVVVDYGTTSGTRSAETRYDNGTGVTIIGGFKTTRPSKGTGTKVWIHTNGTVSSDGNGGSGRTYCSMYTGSGWNSTTLLRIDITGLVIGAGGNGGNGGGSSPGSAGGGGNGTSGTSAIGINTPCSVIVSNRGRIAGGGGGGGGGGGSWGNTWRKGYNADGHANAGGSGGGGGAGSPVGTKGSAGGGSCYYRCGSTGGNDGEDGLSINSGGKGGTANRVDGGNGSSATGGAGGNGGGQGGDGSTGSTGSASGSRTTSTPDGGSPGSSGYAVVTSNASLDIRGIASIYDFVGGTATSTQLT